MVRSFLPALCLLVAVPQAAHAASDVVVLSSSTFAKHIADAKHTLVEFYAPWCGHCKKLEPEFEKAALTLKSRSVPLAKVDATEEKDLSAKYNVKGFPTLIWFEDGKEATYDGGRTSDTIVDWVISMTGPAITETVSPPEPTGDKPRVVLYSGSLLPGFEEAAKANRRKAAWYFVKAPSGQRVELRHKGEDPVVLMDGCGNKDKLNELVTDNLLPLFGVMEGDSFDKYMEAGKGLIWSLFPKDEGTFEQIKAKYTPMMSEVAKQVKKNYFVTITDTERFADAMDTMLAVSQFPAIAVHKKAGDKKKYVYEGEMTTAKIVKFILDVEAGVVQPKLKSAPEPSPSDEPVKTLVSTTLERELFTPDKDVMLFVTAPWCGHCKKLDPEYLKLAKKIKTEELSDLLSITKIDGVANDSPNDAVDWTGFPTLYFAKQGSRDAMVYDGERTAKGLWKYIKKHATRAQEIRERIERRKKLSERTGEL